VIPDVPLAFLRGEQCTSLAGRLECAEEFLSLHNHSPVIGRKPFAPRERDVRQERLADFLKLPAIRRAGQTSAAALTGDYVVASRLRGSAASSKQSRARLWLPVRLHVALYADRLARHRDPFVFGTLAPQQVIGSTTPPAEADRAVAHI